LFQIIWDTTTEENAGWGIYNGDGTIAPDRSAAFLHGAWFFFWGGGIVVAAELK
jgi:hypothetical protein